MDPALIVSATAGAILLAFLVAYGVAELVEMIKGSGDV